MSNAHYDLGSLRFWTEREITIRSEFTKRIVQLIHRNLKSLNPAWDLIQCEGPLLTPRSRISEAYDENDVFFLRSPLGESESVLRPETTPSSYAVAQHMLRTGEAKAPLIVWQVGKSFRRETNDGASPSKLRFNEFYQLELQCIYRSDSKADYRAAVLEKLASELSMCAGGADQRVVESDRLPAYSLQTDDIELPWKNSFVEVCSVSTRTDFSISGHPDYSVLEVAVGLDRLVCVAEKSL